MYLPYLRGKQFELIAARELSENVSSALFKPILEPVRQNLSPLIRTVKHLNEKGIAPLIIVNPSVGDFSNSYQSLIDGLQDHEMEYLPCVAIRGGKSDIAKEVIQSLNREFALQITDGIDKGSIEISRDAEMTIADHDSPPTALSQLNNLILLGDFFKKQKRNADYLSESSFSHLHATYSNQGNVIGFSDYTVIGSEYSESGGPAYVVTIHISYINEERFDEMFVRHYSSSDDGTPTDPAGKFAEALGLLMSDVNNPTSFFYPSTALDEFRKLDSSGHFPGLGQVKKLSMKHHIETVCNYLEEQ
jgi:hypothetical protein